MVPGYTDNETDMERLVDLILPLGFLIDRIEILPIIQWVAKNTSN